MDESAEILLNSLANSGVLIPPGVSSIQDLTPATLVSITAQSLRLMDDTSSYCSTLPESPMSDRYKICTDLASAVKNLGYIGDISFHKFLYPSEEDIYKLVRFFVGKLSELSESGKFSDKKDNNSSGIVEEESFKGTTKEWTRKLDNEGLYSLGEEDVGIRSEDLGLKAEVQDCLATEPKDALLTVPSEPNSNTGKVEGVNTKVEGVTVAVICRSGTQDSSNKKLINEDSTEDFGDSRTFTSGDGGPVAHGDDNHVLELEQKLISPEDQSTKLKQIDAGSYNLVEKLDSQGKHLERKYRSLEESLHARKPECQEKLLQLKEIVLETMSVFSETKKREEELSKLSTNLEKQPETASRRSYIERIKEITKNSRKQDTDIERILKETRELQLESNSIQERLHRTYAVVDETVFREAKKDPVVRQSYRLLANIHESFEHISEKILATDRTQREAADYEAKLAAMASRSLNINKLQADLDAIRKENEFLQQQAHKL